MIKTGPQKLILDVKVKDLMRAVGFYRDILGLPLIQQADDWASFEAFGTKLHLYLHGGVEYGLEFRVADIAKQVAQLKAKGIEFVTDSKQSNLIRISGDIMEFPWGRCALFHDSEGNQLALVQDQQTKGRAANITKYYGYYQKENLARAV